MATLSALFGRGEAATFMGLPPWDGQPAPAVLLGADGCTPYPSVGFYCAGGPAAIRRASAAFDAGKHDFDWGGALAHPLPADAGDVPVREGDPEGNRARVRERVAAILGAGAVPVLLGGDDSLPVPLLDALAPHGPLTVLQVDAHIDWRDEVEGVREGLSSNIRRASEMPHVRRIVQVGQRGMGSARPQEVADARAWGAHLIPAQHPDPVAAALDLVPEGGRVALLLDWDALDPSAMPAVIAPTAGGLTFRELLALLAGLTARARVVGVTATELMPARDENGRGAALAAQGVAALLGLLSRR